MWSAVPDTPLMILMLIMIVVNGAASKSLFELLRAHLGLLEPVEDLQEGGDGETGNGIPQICPLWIHRSSAPPEPLLKREKREGGKVNRR